MLRRIWLGALAWIVVLTAATAAPAAVNVNIGITLPAPPRLIVVPGTPVAYAPSVPGNYFLYAGRYYVFGNGVWYTSRGYNGPWLVLAPEYVPRPLLMVPVQYYHAKPRAWAQWQREAPPRWDSRWGRGWHEGPRHDQAQRGQKEPEHHEDTHHASHREDRR